MLGRIASWLDDRVAFSRSGRRIIDYVFPDHWSFLLGEIAAYSFVILLITGVFLTLFFVPSSTAVVYHGPYAPLRGMTMTEAYDSAIRLSFVVRGGLLCRQAHHWAALIFIAAIVVHMCRVFFTGAYRRPRELNWMVGATLLALSVINGYLGYSLPGDLESGTGIRIGYSIVESIPFVGSYIDEFLFQGQYPGSGIFEERFFIFHVLVLPGLIMALLAVHIALIVRPHHTQFRDRRGDHRNDNVVGTPLAPAYAAKSAGLFFIVLAVTIGLAGVAQINPIWHYGPYKPFIPTDATQPDWYLGWLEGSLRIFPSWEVHFPGHMIPEPFFPVVLLPALTWIVAYAVPFFDRWSTRDRREHHLLARPREHPGRTGFGVAMITFYTVLFLAGGDDVLAKYLEVDAHGIVFVFRLLAVVAPFVAYAVTWKICRELGKAAIATDHERHLIVAREPDHTYRVHEEPLEIDEQPQPVELG